ncbi:MAG: urease accessory protein UreF [Alphaproteobacteria bacterium]|nr:urease accessory protein UreF [Alphaproteobacteria bacterium]
MSSDVLVDLSAFQHADTMFPSGAVSFSFGLEALVNAGIVAGPDDLAGFLTAQLRGRWADLDRPALWHAHRAGADLDAVGRLDRLVEAQTLGAEQRLGSTRMGAAFLGVHAKLGSSLAETYRRRIAEGRGCGHLPVMQGMVWQALSFPHERALLMSAHGLLTGMLGTAIRLSVAGYVESQRLHAALLPVVAEILETPICAPNEMRGFCPQIEIASMIHETDDARLFMN